MTRTLICSCNRTMSPENAAPGTTVHTALCRHEMSHFLQAAQGSEPVLVACTQEQALFSSAAEHSDPPAYAPLRFVNLRETAGWSSEGAPPKGKAPGNRGFFCFGRMCFTRDGRGALGPRLPSQASV